MYQMDIYGNPGPYGMIDFPYNVFPTSCTVNGDRIIIGNDADDGFDDLYLDVYDFSGNFLFQGYRKPNMFDASFGSLAYHDGIVWVSYYSSDGENQPEREIYGLEYREDLNFIRRTTIENIGVGDMSICDADFINIAESSLGKIKAYFAEIEGGGE